jgi:hypothetical protein
VWVSCAACGEEKAAKKHVVEENERHFCDYDCQGEWLSENAIGEDHPSWQGGTVPYGTGWTKKKKEQVRKRQDRICVGCGEPTPDNKRPASTTSRKRDHSKTARTETTRTTSSLCAGVAIGSGSR